uniref:non-specific serine/threonine protein kinase n=1 Tax=Callorhinchus milii TaxID=7868 RepID=A0A4W3HTT2_CALMI
SETPRERESMGDSPLSRTPLPVPAYFRQADETFSLRRRGGAGLGRPPSSRLFPGRSRAWSQPRPLSVSARDAPSRSLSGGLYDESKSELYFEQCFLRLCRLGQGSFGEVFKVRSRVDGRLYAVKRSMELFRGEQDRWQKLEEARKHEGLAPHHNLVGFVSAWEERGRLYIQTELCEGSLQQRVEERGTLGEGEVWDVITDLLPALKHLHDRGVAHMDVKPANVFLSHAGVCKLGDFGLLLDTRERVRERATEGESERGSRGERAELSEAQEGDPRYMAPELLSGVYSRAADVFSLGMSILEICSNLELPRSGDGWQRLRQGYLPLEFVSGLSPSLLSILRLMLEPDPRRRASVDLLLSLPCVRRVRLYRRLRLLVREGLTQIIRVFQVLNPSPSPWLSRCVCVCVSVWLSRCVCVSLAQSLCVCVDACKSAWLSRCVCVRECQPGSVSLSLSAAPSLSPVGGVAHTDGWLPVCCPLPGCTPGLSLPLEPPRPSQPPGLGLRPGPSLLR